MKKIISDWFTGRDNSSFSLTKVIVAGSIVAMIVQFVRTDSANFQDFGIGVAAIVTALAAKYYTEGTK